MAFSIKDSFRKPGDSDDFEGPGIAKQIAGGLLTGAAEDPIAGFFINQAADLLPGVAREDIEQLSQELDGHTLADISKFIGEWGSMIGIGAGAFSAGRIAARAGLRAIAPRLAAKGPASLIGRQAQQFLMREAANVPGITGEAAAGKFLRPGGLERSAEAVGGSLATGLQGGTNAALQGGDLGDIAEAAAVTALLTGGVEAGIYGAARALSPRFKAGGYINELGEVAGLKAAKNLKNSIGGRLWEVRDVESNPRAESFDMINRKGQTRMDVPSMSGRPNTPYVKREIAGIGPKIQQVEEELGRILKIENYEQALKTNKPIEGTQLSLFDSADNLIEQVEHTPKEPRQFGLRATDKTEQKRIAEEFYGPREPGADKPDIEYIPGREDKRTRARRKVISEKSKELGALRGTYQSERALFGEASIEQIWNSQTPYNPDTSLGGLRSWISEYIEQDINAAKKLGMTGRRAVEAVYEANVKSLLTKEKFAERLYNDFTRIAMLLKRPTARPGGEKYLSHYDETLKDVFLTTEKLGLPVTEKVFGREVAGIVKGIQDDLEKLYVPLEKLGAERRLTAADLAARGTASYLPHVNKMGHQDQELVYQKMVDALMAKKQPGKQLKLSRAEAEAEATRIIGEPSGAEGFKKSGSIDYSRDFSGTLVDQTAHFEMEGYATGIFKYATETARRGELSKFFGLDGQVKNNIIALARKEGADVDQLNAILSHYLGPHKIYPQSMNAWSRRIINLQAATKLTLATVPNLFQPLVNNPTSLGIKATLKGITTIPHRGFTGHWMDKIPGLRDLMRHVNSVDEQLVVRSIALNEEYLSAARHIHASNPIADTTITDNIADWALKANFFTASERFNRMSTGVAALLRIREAVTKGAMNKVKGKHLDFTRRQFSSIGLDYDNIVAFAKANPKGTADDAVTAVAGKGSLETSIFKLVRETQFTPTTTHLPRFWQTPHGRLMTQFKSFALHQGILVRDHILAEAALGNMRPLAMATAFYPVTGAVVYNTLSAVKDRKKPQTELGTYLSVMSSVGGFGLTSSMVLSAYYGRLSDALIGPTLTDIGSFGQAAILDVIGDRQDHLWKRVESQPVYNATRAMLKGAGLSIRAGAELLESTGTSDYDDVEETNYNSLITDYQQRARQRSPQGTPY